LKLRYRIIIWIIIAIIFVIYLLLPTDFIPDQLPVLGVLDDIFVYLITTLIGAATTSTGG